METTQPTPPTAGSAPDPSQSQPPTASSGASAGDEQDDEMFNSPWIRAAVRQRMAVQPPGGRLESGQQGEISQFVNAIGERAAQAVVGTAGKALSLPRRAMEASEGLRTTGEYNPAPVVEAASMAVAPGAVLSRRAAGAGAGQMAGDAMSGLGLAFGAQDAANEHDLSSLVPAVAGAAAPAIAGPMRAAGQTAARVMARNPIKTAAGIGGAAALAPGAAEAGPAREEAGALARREQPSPMGGAVDAGMELTGAPGSIRDKAPEPSQELGPASPRKQVAGPLPAGTSAAPVLKPPPNMDAREAKRWLKAQNDAQAERLRVEAESEKQRAESQARIEGEAAERKARLEREQDEARIKREQEAQKAQDERQRQLQKEADARQAAQEKREREMGFREKHPGWSTAMQFGGIPLMAALTQAGRYGDLAMRNSKVREVLSRLGAIEKDLPEVKAAGDKARAVGMLDEVKDLAKTPPVVHDKSTVGKLSPSKAAAAGATSAEMNILPEEIDAANLPADAPARQEATVLEWVKKAALGALGGATGYSVGEKIPVFGRRMETPTARIKGARKELQEAAKDMPKQAPAAKPAPATKQAPAAKSEAAPEAAPDAKVDQFDKLMQRQKKQRAAVAKANAAAKGQPAPKRSKAVGEDD